MNCEFLLSRYPKVARCSLMLTFLIALVLSIPHSFAQEAGEIQKWTDITGARTIEAKFLRIEGDSVVLERASGQEIKVQMSKLNLTSQALAKRLANPKAFEKKPSAPKEMKPSDTSNKNEDGSAANTSKTELIPRNKSAADTLAFVRAEVEKGNCSVLADTIGDEELGKLSKTLKVLSTKMNKSTFDSVKALFKRSAKVLTEKKDFVMNYPRIPSDVKPRLSAHYDTAAGAINEVSQSPVSNYQTWTDGDATAVMGLIAKMIDVYQTQAYETELKLKSENADSLKPALPMFGFLTTKQDIISGQIKVL